MRTYGGCRWVWGVWQTSWMIKMGIKIEDLGDHIFKFIFSITDPIIGLAKFLSNASLYHHLIGLREISQELRYLLEKAVVACRFSI